MIVNGRAIARDILKQVRADLSGRTVTVRAVSVAPNAATESYLGTKARKAADAGMTLEIMRLPDTATTEDVIAACAESSDALLVQLPLPAHIDTKTVLDAIPLTKDADVLSAESHTVFEDRKEGALLPPVVDALKEILERSAVAVVGKRAVVVGNGWLVGEPCATWLRQEGADVSVVTKQEGNLSTLGEADIVVCGAGTPGLVRPEHLREGVVLIDAGTSESDGAIVGDATPECASVASVFTPVPGGVGPIAVACLFRNAARLALRNAPKAL